MAPTTLIFLPNTIDSIKPDNNRKITDFLSLSFRVKVMVSLSFRIKTVVVVQILKENHTWENAKYVANKDIALPNAYSASTKIIIQLKYSNPLLL